MQNVIAVRSLNKMVSNARTIGVLGATALGALIYGWVALSEVQQENAVLREKLAHTAAKASAAIGSFAVLNSPVPNYFHDDLSLVVKDIHQLSQQRGLAVSDAKYSRVDRAAITDIDCMRIETRVRGSYQELKNFLAEVLAAHDGLSLDSVSIRRGMAADAKVDVQLTFSLYYRKRT